MYTNIHMHTYRHVCIYILIYTYIYIWKSKFIATLCHTLQQTTTHCHTHTPAHARSDTLGNGKFIRQTSFHILRMVRNKCKQHLYEFLQCVAVRCSALQCVAGIALSMMRNECQQYLYLLQCVAVCCSVLLHAIVCCRHRSTYSEVCVMSASSTCIFCSVLHVLQYVAVCCSLVQVCKLVMVVSSTNLCKKKKWEGKIKLI